MTTPIVIALSAAIAVLGALVLIVRARRSRRQPEGRYERFLRTGSPAQGVVAAVRTERADDGADRVVQIVVRYTAADGVERWAKFEKESFAWALDHDPTVGQFLTVVYLPDAPAEVELEAAVRSAPQP